MTTEERIAWLLKGDVSIQYQVHRDLYGIDKPRLQQRIAREGWGAKFLSSRKADGHWGRAYYQPKWTSTHYTLLDLKNLAIAPDNKPIRKTLELVFENDKGPDGGINPLSTWNVSDVCINGMALNFASYFRVKEKDLRSLIDCLLKEQMEDGGFNCYSNRGGARHSSLHSTLSVAEGFCEYKENGYTYRLREVEKAERGCREFMLMHRLFRSDRTGKVIKPAFLQLHYPPRWYYDILRALDYFRAARVKYDKRMEEAIAVVLEKKTKDGLWKLAAHYPGQVHFKMEEAGKPSRWNTLRALRVLKHFRAEA
jgi:hypothetical protein